MKGIALLVLFGCFLNIEAQERVVTVASQIKELREIERLPNYKSNTKILQVSSYDTTGGNDDGFSGEYSFVRRNPDGSLVIFEEKGKGVINRIWTPTPTEDTLDFYFGKAKEPSFSIKFSDLFSGKVYPFIQPLAGNEIGGYYNYFPIPFSDGCKIVFRGKHLQFYQIQHRNFPQNYKVENFSEDLSDEEKEELQTLITTWEKIGDFGTAKVIEADTLIQPGQTVTLANIKDPGRILGFEIENAAAFEGLNKQVDIKITWDNEIKPAIYAPLADFFGYAFGKVSMQSLLLGTRNNINYSYFPMPFDEKAKIELIYRSSGSSAKDVSIPVKGKVYVTGGKRDSSKEGKFYTYWNSNKNAPLGEPHLLLKGEGKGHYVGTVLQTQGLDPGMTLFFEGDDVTTIDGEMRVHGTGSEDYFNGGWYALLDRWDRKVSLPLHGALDYSLPFSRTGGYRLFISDKMPFNESIHHTIEHGPEENNKPVDYTSVAYYYADASVHEDQEIPNSGNTLVYVPDTFVLYPQLMKYSFAGIVNVDRDILTSTTGGHVRIDLSEIPKGSYKLYADIEKSSDGTEISVWQRQKEVAESVSFYAEERELEDKKYICDIVLDDFKETITLRFPPDGERSKINIRRLILEKQ